MADDLRDGSNLEVALTDILNAIAREMKDKSVAVTHAESASPPSSASPDRSGAANMDVVRSRVVATPEHPAIDVSGYHGHVHVAFANTANTKMYPTSLTFENDRLVCTNAQSLADDGNDGQRAELGNMDFDIHFMDVTYLQRVHQLASIFADKGKYANKMCCCLHLLPGSDAAVQVQADCVFVAHSSKEGDDECWRVLNKWWAIGIVEAEAAEAGEVAEVVEATEAVEAGEAGEAAETAEAHVLR